MFSPHEAERLQNITQAILTGQQQFSNIQPRIEAIVPAINTLDTIRLRRLPPGAALGHMVASQTMLIEQGEPHTLSDGAPYDQYRTRLETVDRQATQLTVNRIRTEGGPHNDSLDYYYTQNDLLTEFAAANQDKASAQGKDPLSYPDETAEDHLAGQIVESTALTIPSLIIREAVRLYQITGVLPSDESLKKHFRKFLKSNTDQSTLPGQLFLNYQLGRLLSGVRVKQLRKNQTSNLGSSTWTDVLIDTIADGHPPDHAIHLARALHDDTTPPISLRKGYCPAQFVLQPYEAETNQAAADLATAYFAQWGIDLHKGQFRAADYQFLRCVDTATATFLIEPASREALELIAKAGTRL